MNRVVNKGLAYEAMIGCKRVIVICQGREIPYVIRDLTSHELAFEVASVNRARGQAVVRYLQGGYVSFIENGQDLRGRVADLVYVDAATVSDRLLADLMPVLTSTGGEVVHA